MANHTVLQAANRDGDQLSVQHTSTDSPILPAANMRELQSIDPNLVPFIVEQTRLEAEFRRSENKRTNTFIFFERISGVVAGVAVSLVGLSLGYSLIMNGHDWGGVGICGTSLATIVYVLVTKRKPDTTNEDIAKPTSQNRKSRTKRS